MAKKASSVSLGNTPVQRALRNAKRSTLLILFAAGIVGGLVYKAYFSEKPEDVTPPAAVHQQP